MAATRYQILMQDEGAEEWADGGVVTAHGARAARRAFAETLGREVVIVAIPVRSWQPRVLAAKTKTTLVERAVSVPQPRLPETV